MFVPDVIRKCVAFIQYESPTSGTRISGTAFFVSHQVNYGELKTDRLFFEYVVTARHCIDGVRERSVDGKVQLRINSRNGTTKVIDTNVGQWLFHPLDRTADVAVFPWLGDPDIDVVPVKTSVATSQEQLESNGLGLGDEIMVTGLFVKRPGSARNIPIIRVGNLAALCEEAVPTGMGPMEAYLVELRSIGGLSGSPVFIQRERGFEFHLLGVMHGHWNIKPQDTAMYDADYGGDQPLNIGIGAVVPASKVLEILELPELATHRDLEIASCLRQKRDGGRFV